MGLSASASIDQKGRGWKHRLHRYRRCKPAFLGSNLKPDRMQTEPLMRSHNGRFMEVSNKKQEGKCQAGLSALVPSRARVRNGGVEIKAISGTQAFPDTVYRPQVPLAEDRR